ncbi:MAG: hypothetical protein M3437_05205 [Chloroflexota bacterium]|nr:hypothetical protein [Chloroflexota bacterium]MDQ5865450.1 hypothetical protein [Chloroflexota bacterium]
MRGSPTATPGPTTERVASPGGPAGPRPTRSSWLNLAWKLVLAAVILLLMSVGSPLSWLLSWTLLNPVMATLLVWGALVVGAAGSNLFEGDTSLRWAWSALAVGAYLALTLPTLVTNTPSRLVDALGPVAGLTLVAHLGRRDLQRALRDWALVMSLALYAALGVHAMWLLLGVFANFGPRVFLLSVLLPPILFEAILLALRRIVRQGSLLPAGVALLMATLLSAVVVSANLLNQLTEPTWLLIFGLIIAVLIGTGLVVSYLTRPLMEAASGAHRLHPRAIDLGRALVELSHGPILISLALYLPLRLLR